MKKPKHLLIDADLIAYRSSAAIETRFIVVEHKASGRKMRFNNRTEFWGKGKEIGGWLAEKNKEQEENGKPTFIKDDFEIHDDVELEPKENAYHIVKKYIEGFLKVCEADSYTLYLDGGDNFRVGAATILEYKGKRDSQKPVHLEDVKQYMKNYHPCVIADGIEADDILSIEGYKGNGIQVSCDKDQKQTPSWIYDYDKSEKPFEVKDGVGKVWFDSGGKARAIGFKSLCLQMITSDDVDNIKPRALTNKRFGEKKAVALLSPLKTKKDCLQAVLDTYKTWYGTPVEYLHWSTGEEITATWFEIASEMFTLLYMLRDYDDSTTLASLCDELDIKVEL